MVTLSDIALPYRLAYLKHQAEFRCTFGKPLKDFWDGNILGLDIIAFDRFIAPDDNESLQDAITRRWSAGAATMIEELIHGVQPDQ